jgi:hypothetical protein
VGVAKGEEEIHILAPTLLISKIEKRMKQVKTIPKSRVDLKLIFTARFKIVQIITNAKPPKIINNTSFEATCRKYQFQ